MGPRTVVGARQTKSLDKAKLKGGFLDGSWHTWPRAAAAGSGCAQSGNMRDAGAGFGARQEAEKPADDTRHAERSLQHPSATRCGRSSERWQIEARALRRRRRMKASRKGRS